MHVGWYIWWILEKSYNKLYLLRRPLCEQHYNSECEHLVIHLSCCLWEDIWFKSRAYRWMSKLPSRPRWVRKSMALWPTVTWKLEFTDVWFNEALVKTRRRNSSNIGSVTWSVKALHNKQCIYSPRPCLGSVLVGWYSVWPRILVIWIIFLQYR